MALTVVGVHPIPEADQPCCMFEVAGEPLLGVCDFGGFTQEADGKPRSGWQVAYGEEPVGDEYGPWIFFMYHVQFDRPLITPYGPVPMPEPTPVPDRLKRFVWESPE